MSVSDEEDFRHSDENTYLDVDSHTITYLTPSSPAYQILLERGSRTNSEGRRLSRAQEMAMVERKGTRRVSGGLRVESGGLRKVRMDELDPSPDRAGKVGEQEKENVNYRDTPRPVRTRSGKEEVRMEMNSPVQTPCPAVKRMKKPSLQNLQDLSLQIDAPGQTGRSVGKSSLITETPPPKAKTARRLDYDIDNEKGRLSGDREVARSPESPATMTCFEQASPDVAEGTELTTPRRSIATTVVAKPKTETAATTPKATANTGSTAPTTPPAAPRKPPTQSHPQPQIHARRSSLSNLLESLKRTYTTTTSTLTATFVAVGHGSGVPERQVVRRFPSQVEHGERKTKIEQEEMEQSKKQEVDEGQDGGWGGKPYDPEVARKSWIGWEDATEVRQGWRESQQQAEHDDGNEDPREVLAGIANDNALTIEAASESREEEERRRENGSETVLGLSLGLGGPFEDGQSGWKTFDSDGVQDGSIRKNEEPYLQLLEGLTISDVPPHPKPVELPVIAPPRKPIDYRHIIHLAANALGEPRPERIIHHPALSKIVAVAQVDFNQAVMGIMMEATQGPLHQEHYTLHDLYSWYKVTFKRRKAEVDTLQALILALIQVGTGRDLGEREESTLQAIQGKSTVLCAVPLGYCMVHPCHLHRQPNEELMREIEIELMAGRDPVSPEMDADDGLTEMSEILSGRSVPLTPPATPKRRLDKGKARAIEADNDILSQRDQLDPPETPPRPSSALPISNTQYSLFPRVIGMVSHKLRVTTELALFQSEVCRALALAGMTCEQFQDVMFKAQDLDQEEMSKPWQEREFEPEDGKWRAYRYHQALITIAPFGEAQYVQQLPEFQRAIIYLLMMCFEWPEDDPEGFVERLCHEHRMIIDHTPYKPPTRSPQVKIAQGHGAQPSIVTDKPSSVTTEDWYEYIRTHELQIGPSTKIWQSSSA